MISVMTGANPFIVSGIGLVAAAGIMVIGWMDDRITGAAARASLAARDALPASAHSPQAFPLAAFWRFLAVCLSLVAICAVLITFTGSRVVPALMLASPIVTLVWVWLQFRKRGFTRRVKDIVSQSVPAGSPEAVTLSAAGYIGIVVAGLSNPQWLVQAVGLEVLAPVMAYLAAMAIVPLASNLAMPPMLTVTFLGSLYSRLPGSPLDPSLLAAAFALGWAINLTASPFGATSLILSRITGIAGTTLSWKWNGRFSLLACVWAGSVLLTVALLRS